MKSLKSLEHLPQLSKVKSFRAYSSGLEDISALQNLPNLQRAIFHNCSDLKNVDCLGEQSNLKELTLSSTDVEKRATMAITRRIGCEPKFITH